MMSPDTFAAAWLEKFADVGGGVTIDRGAPCFFFKPEQWQACRTLLDLIEMIHGGADAVAQHMQSHGLHTYHNATKERIHAC